MKLKQNKAMVKNNTKAVRNKVNNPMSVTMYNPKHSDGFIDNSIRISQEQSLYEDFHENLQGTSPTIKTHHTKRLTGQ